ncbi:hypothetical protein [Acetonema longum]|uniref:Uncharacterized protein n=1 Tax=Acetonema longum DSM 6540 TaxID=1009370 RepID=F7NKS3_9FIRM|nr:hypothetical protein [Acetonema longum]EGO63377.1 hypothetical protein ALO_13459 [Acetonema longum DSM 6540]
MCKYSRHFYWEHLLSTPRDPWQTSFITAGSAGRALFVNTVIIDYRRNTLDNNWAGYPDVKALLGFLQYLHLPLVFYHTLRQNEEELYFPVCSSDEFLNMIADSESRYAPVMREAVLELNGLWKLDEEQCLARLRDFCRCFNAFWRQNDYILNISLFANTRDIAHYVLDQSEFPEVLEEDIGLTADQLFHLCDNFYREPLVRRNFVKLLNHKIGCVI